jgi:minor extracellular serine protease Vpr
MTWTDDTGIFPNPTAGQPSSFTSWGLAPSLNQKPDIAAPGGLIQSAWPMEQGGFATISGTSMAAPHVAGAAALFLQKHGDTNPLVLRGLLQNNAVPSNFPGTAFANAVHRQGAGTLQIDDAILATARVTPGKLPLGEGTAAQTRSLTITNNGTSAVTYELVHQRAVGTSASTYAPGAVANFATVSFSSPSVTVPAGGTATVDVTITPLVAATTDRTVYTGYVRLTPTSGGGPTLRVAYAGFTGDYQTIRVLAPGACEFPGIFKAGGSTTCPGGATLTGRTRQAAGATYNVGNRPDRPVVLFHLAHQSQRVEIRAVNASGEEFLVARTDLAERNPTNDLADTGFFVYTWDGKAVFTNEKNGTVNRRSLPSGAYKLKLVVTKALAEPGNPAHTEIWESPTLNIVAG